MQFGIKTHNKSFPIKPTHTHTHTQRHDVALTCQHCRDALLPNTTNSIFGRQSMQFVTIKYANAIFILCVWRESESATEQPSITLVARHANAKDEGLRLRDVCWANETRTGSSCKVVCCFQRYGIGLVGTEATCRGFVYFLRSTTTTFYIWLSRIVETPSNCMLYVVSG